MKRDSKSPARCVLDSGGLSALCGRSRRAAELVRWIVEHHLRVVIPTPILVECTTGTTRDAELNRVINAIARDGGAVVAPDEETARVAGALRYRARTDDGIDALVAAIAIGDGTRAILLTSDEGDLTRLVANARNVGVRKV